MTDEKRRNELLTKLTELDKHSEDIEATFRAGLEQSVRDKDVRKHLYAFFQSVKSDNQVPPEAWSAWESGVDASLEAARITRAQLSELHLYQGTSGSVLTSSSTAMAYIHPVAFPAALADQLQFQVQQSPPPSGWTADQVKAFQDLSQGLKAAFAYKDWLPDVIALTQKLGADDAHPGTETALDHFCRARLAYEQPPGGVTSPVAVLVELRSGVSTLLERLRRRLVGQYSGTTIRDRVVNIGKQAGYRVFAPSHFDSIGRDLSQLTEDLNDAKGASMSRVQVGEVLNKVFYTLRLLLTGVDPSRLRPR